MDDSDPTAIALVQAIKTGDTATLSRLLQEHPGLASEQVHGTRTPLHVATDWPGYFPNGPAVVRMLLEAGAEPNAVVTGKSQTETPLHWAASTDDADVAETLIAGGADIEAAGGSIGTPLHNAVGYGCWHVARLLVQRGAQVWAA
jgi:ankyrin repeat protein